MHGHLSLETSLNQDRLTFRELILLFAGYVDGGDGQLFTGMVHKVKMSQPRGLESLELVKITETTITEGVLTGPLSLQVKATTKNSLVLTEFGDLSTVRNAQRLQDIKEILRLNEFYEVGQWNTGAAVWMLRNDAYRFACAYLKQKPSPHGFIYDAGSDFVVSKVIDSEDIASILALTDTWLSKASLKRKIPRHEQIVQAIQNAFKVNPISAYHSWSRRAMQAIAALDNTISQVASEGVVTGQMQSILWTAVGAIYASNQTFRNNLINLLEKLAVQDQEVSIARDILRIEKENIAILGTDGTEIEHSFDFRYVFTEAKLNQFSFHNVKLPLIDTLLASLQGQLRAVAWKMALSPLYLKFWQVFASDISLVDTYVPQRPGPEIWLGSTTDELNAPPPPVIGDQYAPLDVALDDMRKKYANSQVDPSQDEDRSREIMGTGTNPTITHQKFLDRQTYHAQRLPLSAAALRQLIRPASSDGDRHVLQSTLGESVTNAVLNLLDGVKTTRAQLSAESSAERESSAESIVYPEDAASASADTE